MSVSTFIPAVWSRVLLTNLFKSQVFAQPSVVNRDYEGDIAGLGSSVKIHNIGPITISDYTVNTDLTAPEALTDGETVLTIDRQKAFNFQIDDVDNAQSVPKLMEGAMVQAAYNLSDELDAYLGSLYTSAGITTGFGTTGSPIVPTASTAYEYLADAYTALDEANAPRDGRWCIVPPWFHGLMRKDSRFILYTDSNRETLGNALIGEAAGFQVFVSNNVFNTSGAKYRIMFGHPSAWTVANSVEKVEAFRMEKRFADALKGLHVYGAKVVRPTILGAMCMSKS